MSKIQNGGWRPSWIYYNGLLRNRFADRLSLVLVWVFQLSLFQLGAFIHALLSTGWRCCKQLFPSCLLWWSRSIVSFVPCVCVRACHSLRINVVVTWRKWYILIDRCCNHETYTCRKLCCTVIRGSPVAVVSTRETSYFCQLWGTTLLCEI